MKRLTTEELIAALPRDEHERRAFERRLVAIYEGMSMSEWIEYDAAYYEITPLQTSGWGVFRESVEPLGLVSRENEWGETILVRALEATQAGTANCDDKDYRILTAPLLKALNPDTPAAEPQPEQCPQDLEEALEALKRSLAAFRALGGQATCSVTRTYAEQI